MTVYAVNGLGRIGKLALRPLLERGAEVAFLNDAVGDPAMHAHLLEFDTVHGRWDATFSSDAGSLTIDGMRIPVHGTRDLDALPLEGVDIVIDCTGGVQDGGRARPLLRGGGEEGRRLGAGEGRRRGQRRLRRQPRRLRPGRAPDRDGGVVHDQLPRPGGEGDP